MHWGRRMVLGVGEVGQDSLEMEGLAGVEQRGARGDGAVCWAWGQERPGQRMSVRVGWQQGRARGADECDVKSQDMAGCQTDTSRTRCSLPTPSVPSAGVTMPHEPRAGQAQRDRQRGTATTAHTSFCHPLVLLFGTAGWEQTHTSSPPVQINSLKPSTAWSSCLLRKSPLGKSGDRDSCEIGP